LHKDTFPAALVVGACAALGGCHHSSNGGSSTPLPVYGLDARPSNTTCVAPSRMPSGDGATIALSRVFANLAFSQPLAMLQAPGDDSRWFVLEKGGSVRVFANTPNVTNASTFLSVSVNTSSEGGLLGMAFHPDWPATPEAFLSFTEGVPMVSVVARFRSADGGQTLDSTTREDIIRVNQPYGNHDGGQIAFGPDRNLYIGFGDGGSAGDPQGHAQDTTDLLGSFLRLDVDGVTPYAIPSGANGNPFAGNPKCPADHSGTQNCPEIYAWGVRNPWRWSFDSATGDLWAGDVGQNSFEEIDRIERGGNYGWNCREGFSAYSGCTIPASAFVDPVHDYGRTEGYSVTGGYVYRGATLSALVGRYVFADFGSGRIWRLVDDGVGGYTAGELLDTSLSIASFGQGNDGELYVVDFAGGALHEIVDGGSSTTPSLPVPAQLSATGCVSAQDPSRPAAGLIPYAPAAPFWSDGAVKERWLAIPDGTSIAVQSDGDFTFPNGSVLMKHFRIGNALVETRLFMRHPDGVWAGYSYEWNAAQTDATLVQGGKTVSVAGQSWIFPSENDCLACHTVAAGFALGLETAQLNRDFVYPGTGRTSNELATLDHVALFTRPIGDPSTLPAMPDPLDSTAPLGERARAYLHTNCSQCHRPSGPTPSSMDLRYSTLLANTNACAAAPQSGDLGLGSGARIIAPGDPALSVLVARANRRDANGMPPLASAEVDADGVTLLSDWIAGLAGCQ